MHAARRRRPPKEAQVLEVTLDRFVLVVLFENFSAGLTEDPVPFLIGKVVYPL
jgi:hypothetical protein